MSEKCFDLSNILTSRYFVRFYSYAEVIAVLDFRSDIPAIDCQMSSIILGLIPNRCNI